MKPVKVYVKDWCPFCTRAKKLLEQKGVAFEEISIEGKTEMAQQLFAQTGFRTVPQVFIGDECVGGFTELAQLEQQGELDAKLADG